MTQTFLLLLLYGINFITGSVVGSHYIQALKWTLEDGLLGVNIQDVNREPLKLIKTLKHTLPSNHVKMNDNSIATLKAFEELKSKLQDLETLVVY